MHDAIQFERLGLPATIVITTPFQGLVASAAATLGAPGYHSVMVPHPVSTRDEAHLKKLASGVADVAARQLSGPPGA